MPVLFFIIKCHTHVNLRSYKIRKITSLVNFHSLYQLLHSQVYCHGLKLCISKVKICINNCDWLISGSHSHYKTEHLESCLKCLLVKS